MLELIERNRQKIDEICRNRHIERLELFGSAASDDADVDPKDLDLLVEFSPLSSAQRVESYFGLQEDLAALLGLPVDLVEQGAIRNPYFLESIEATKKQLYAAT